MPTREFKYKRILIINPFGIGDVLFTTPIIRAIKENIPDASVGYVCNRRTEEILKANPRVDFVHVYERDEYRLECSKSKIKCLKKLVSFLKEIRAKKYDLVIDLSLGRQYNFFSWLVGIKKRVGFNYKKRGVFLTDKIDIPGYENKHVVDFYLGLLRVLKINYKSNRLEIFSTKKEDDWAEVFLRSRNIPNNQIIVGLIPGGGASWGKDASRKHWPQEKFAQLGKMISKDFNAHLLIFGDDREADACAHIAEIIGPKAVSLAGLTNLTRFVALLRKCRVAIANDGGPLHVAVASGIKTVSIFGPVDERVYGPYPKTSNHIIIKNEVLCRPCYRRFRMPDCSDKKCLNEIGVDAVYQAVRELL